MDRTPLDVSPVAKFLVGLVERRASGAVVLPQRSVLLTNGDVHDVTATEGDADFGDFLLRSGRVSEAERKRAEAQAAAGGIVFEQALTGQSRLRSSEVRALKRAFWLDRFLRSLRASLAGEGAAPVLSPIAPAESAANSGERARFLPMLLDALGRIALDADAAEVGLSLKHRFVWQQVPLAADAVSWASFGDLPEQPVIAAMLARLPACAPQIAALVRAGFARLEPPGGIAVRRVSRTETLPPPPPRLAILPESPPTPPTKPESVKPASRAEREHKPRLQLEPGGSGIPIEPIPALISKTWPTPGPPLDDPLRELEQAVADTSRDASERARVYTQLATLWEQRIGSLEEATRALREAVAADPDNAALMEQAAEHCFRLGQGDLAVRYANAALAVTDDVADRTRQHTIIARVEQARGDLDACIHALSEATAENPEDPTPHEGMAQILSDRDQLQLAAAHLRMAAEYNTTRDATRALLLHALAYSWDPSHAGAAARYADLLERQGFCEASIAIVSETARNLSGHERREALERAAERAERNKRRDMRAELLLEIFDSQPNYQAIHARLAASLDRPGLETEYAAVLEVIALHSHGPERPDVLARCADALARIEGERETSARYQQLARAGRTNDAAAPNANTLIRELEAQLTAARSPTQDLRSVPRLTRLAALRTEVGDARGVVSTCLRILSVEPNHPMAAARLARATAALSDQVLHREALVLLARLRSGREQGRALAVLARQLEDMGEFDAAVSSAEAALSQDSSAADAAIIALRHVHRLDPRRARALLAQARELLASPPALLLSMAEASRAASDPNAQLESLHELSRGLPFLLQPRLLALNLALTTPDPELIASEADRLLDHCVGPDVTECGRNAVTRLAELGDYASAARLSERLMACQGFVDPAFADRACSLAHMAGDPNVLARAFERAASVHEGGTRANCLLQLAAHHASHADRVAELHALLRALAMPEGRARTLPILAQRFAEAGDKNRLLTVVSLQLDGLSDTAARNQLWFDAASAALTLGDAPIALAYMRALFQENANDRQGLLFGLGALFALGDAEWALAATRDIATTLPPEAAGLLFLWIANRAELAGARAQAFELAAEGARLYPSVGELLLLAERLTLASHDKQAALGLYAELVQLAMGPHGQRALHYRAGRWLERAGEPAEALPHYRAAFELAKGAGVAFHALSRAARAANRLDILVEAQQTLAAALNDENTRAPLIAHAARTSLDDMADPARAIRIIADAEEQLPAGRLDELLQRAALELHKSDPEAARDALQALIAARNKRIADMWDGEPKAELSLSLARLQRNALGDIAASIESFERVLNSDLRTSLSSEGLAAGLVDYAEALGQAARNEDAEAALSEARMLVPSVPRPRLALKSEPPSTLAPTSEPPSTLAPTSELPPALSVPGDLSRRARGERAAAGSTNTESEEALRARASTGDADALEALVQRLDSEPGRRDEAHALLGQLVRVAPERLAALRQLYARARELRAQAEAQVCAQILSLLDTSISAPPRVPFDPEDLSTEELSEIVYAGERPELAEVLSLLWQHAVAIPRLRRTPEMLQAGEPVTDHGDTPLQNAYTRATSMLGVPHLKLFTRAGALPEVSALPTHPPVIVLRTGLADEVALEFMLARSLVQAAPQHALLCTLPESEGRALLIALLEAFGHDPRKKPLSRAAKELATELLQSIPARTQARMRELLEPYVEQVDYEELRQQAERSAQRAGLFVCSDVNCALRTIARTDEALRDCDIRTEVGFVRACQRSDAFREVIRSALSLPFVGLTALTRETRL